MDLEFTIFPNENLEKCLLKVDDLWRDRNIGFV